MNQINNLRSVNLNLLVVLYELLIECNVSRTAEKLAMSQSAVSHSLGRLREMFEDDLFIPSRYGMTPTPKALEMQRDLEKILHRAGCLINGIHKEELTTVRRTFRIAISDYGSYLFLAPVLEKIRQTAPGIELALFQSDHHLIAEQLESNLIHMGFCISDAVYQELHTTHLYHERLICIVGKKADIPEMGVLSAKSYASIPHLVVSGLKEAHREIDSILYQKGYRKKIMVVVPHCTVAAHTLGDSDMILILPYRLAISLPELKELRQFELPVPTGRYPYSLIWHPRSKTDPVLQWLITLFSEAAREIEHKTGGKL